MIGAMNFDTTLLKGKSLLSLDGFEEKTIINESACFYDLLIKNNFCFNDKFNYYYKISINGLPGGHSGFDINKNKNNSIILLANLIKKFDDFNLIDFYGGTKFNVIPNEATCKFYTSLSLDKIKNICNNFIAEYQNTYRDLNYKIEIINQKENSLNKNDSFNFINFLINFPNGVIYSYNNFPTTSANLAVINLKKQEIKVGFRSSRKKEEEIFLDNLKTLLNKNNFHLIIYGYQPGFETKNSKLIATLLKTSPYKNTIVTPVHITVELGFFKEKIKDLDVAIISPNIKGAHSTKECVEISSIEKTDKWLKDFISNYD